MNNTKKSGMSLSAICFIVQIVFLVLKLTGVITWPWLYVCIPAMIIAASLVLSIIILIVYAIIVALND